MDKSLIVVSIEELFFQVRVESTFERAGHAVRLLSAAESQKPIIWQSLGCSPVMWLFDLALLDELEEQISWVKAQFPRCHVVGFGPHVEAAAFKRARAVGTDQTLARSRLVQLLPVWAGSLAEPGWSPGNE